MGIIAADTNKNISERGFILDPVLQPTAVPSAVINQSINQLTTYLYLHVKWFAFFRLVQGFRGPEFNMVFVLLAHAQENFWPI